MSTENLTIAFTVNSTPPRSRPYRPRSHAATPAAAA